MFPRKNKSNKFHKLEEILKEHKKENRETFELFTRQADRLLSLSFSTF